MADYIAQIEDRINKIKNLPDSIQKVEQMFHLCRFYIEVDMEKCIALLSKAVEIANRINYKPGEGYKAMYAGFHLWTQSQFNESLAKGKVAIKIFEDADCKGGLSEALSFSAYIHWDMGNYDIAFEYGLKSLKLAEAAKSELGTGWAHHALGVFYSNLKDHSEALAHFKKALSSFESVTEEEVYGRARVQSAMATVYIQLGNLDEAIGLINNTLETYENLGQKTGCGRALNDLGVIYKTKGDLRLAEKYLSRSLEIRILVNHKQGIITTNTELGELYLKEKKYPLALEKLEQACIIAEELNVKPKLTRIHKLIGEVYKQSNEPRKAIEHIELSFKIKGEVSGEEANNRLKNLQTQFATERSEREAEIHRLRHVELKKVYDEIEQKNKDITDSINYARRIQTAILPKQNSLDKFLPEHFILYKPKDIVSGDFYWAAEKNGKKFVAAVDCTGHGVPGAFMSIIGMALLNEIVVERGIPKPSEILNQLREGVIKYLQQTGADEENKDGMDIALLAFGAENGRWKIEYAGANNPLWIIRNANSEAEFTEIKASKQPIGVHIGTAQSFINNDIEVNPGDRLYIFTDGYADQFGGPHGKKFKYKQLQQLLMDSSKRSCGQQKEILNSTFDNWKGKLEQVDDVLIIGIRF
ncbi:MAG: tetratricopeptide repeat protein [Bacteroidetes bacterium]|nr:tetratricopeptide repeat protein [Bacteroidota bacterium]